MGFLTTLSAFCVRHFPKILFAAVALFFLVPVVLTHTSDGKNGLVCIGGQVGGTGIWSLPPQAQLPPATATGPVSGPQSSDPRLGTPCTVTTANAAPGTSAGVTPGTPGMAIPGTPAPLPGQPMP